MTEDEIRKFDYLDAGASEEEQQVESFGLRAIQHFNKHALRSKTLIANGGYGIKNDSGDAPEVGPDEIIKHQGGKTSNMKTAKAFECAVIGWTGVYWILESNEDGAVPQMVDKYIPTDEASGVKCRSAITLFVVPKADSARRLYQVTFKGFNTDKAIGVCNDVKRAAKMLKDHLRYKSSLHPFVMWVKLGVVDESINVGSKEQSEVTPPEIKWDVKPLTVAHIMERMTTPDEYRYFAEMLPQVKDLIAGRYTPQNGATAQLPAPMAQRTAIPAAQGAPGLPPPRYNDAPRQEVVYDGDPTQSDVKVCDWVMGHSVGEFTQLLKANGLTLRDAFKETGVNGIGAIDWTMSDLFAVLIASKAA